MTKSFYTNIHKFYSVFAYKTTPAKLFAAFFSVASVCEIILARVVLYLSRIGKYDILTAERYAPEMTEAAVLSLILSLMCAVILDYGITDSRSRT